MKHPNGHYYLYHNNDFNELSIPELEDLRDEMGLTRINIETALPHIELLIDLREEMLAKLTPDPSINAFDMSQTDLFRRQVLDNEEYVKVYSISLHTIGEPDWHHVEINIGSPIFINGDKLFSPFEFFVTPRVSGMNYNHYFALPSYVPLSYFEKSLMEGSRAWI